MNILNQSVKCIFKRFLAELILIAFLSFMSYIYQFKLIKTAKSFLHLKAWNFGFLNHLISRYYDCFIMKASFQLIFLCLKYLLKEVHNKQLILCYLSKIWQSSKELLQPFRFFSCTKSFYFGGKHIRGQCYRH